MTEQEVIEMLGRLGYADDYAAHLVETKAMCGCGDFHCDKYQAKFELERATAQLEIAQSKYDSLVKKVSDAG